MITTIEHRASYKTAAYMHLVPHNMNLLPRGVLAVYMTGGPTELHIANPKKYMSLKFYTPQKYLASKFSTPKNTRLSSSILIYSIKQTLRGKKIRGSTLDPKITEGVNFQPKYIRPPRHVYCKYPLPPPPPGIYYSILV